MVKYVRAVAAFFLLLALGITALLQLNHLTPVLPSGSPLPSGLSQRQYALVDAVWDPDQEGYHLTLAGTVEDDLMLTVADMDEASILFWGESMATWGNGDLYQRVRTVTLPAQVIRQNNGVDLLFRSSTWGSGAKELLSRQTMSLAKLLLGGAGAAQKASTLAFGVSMFSAGLHVLLIISSLALYRRKNTEKYLLFLAFVGAVSLLATLLTTNLPLIPIQSSFYYILRPLISICPTVLHVAIGLSLLGQYVPSFLKRFLTVRTLFLMALALTLARFLSDYSIYTATRWILMIPVVWTLSRACAQRAQGAWPLLVGYALSEAVVVFLFLINNFQLTAAGAIVVCLHTHQLSYLFVLLPAMLVINQRFADKFRESEKLSAELSAINTRLDQLVEQRTNQLWEEQARKNNMMTNIFHDIRSPIFVLQGNLDQIHLPQVEEPLRTAMKNKLSFLTRLTEDLFLISKLEEGMVLYEENPLDLSELLALLAQANQDEAREAGISLAFHCREPLPVWADRQRLHQALQNLLDNAFRYTPEGGSVSLDAFRDGEAVVVQVRDTGFGIAEKDIPLLFERYFKGSRADNPRSSGLGLYIAKEIVEHHQGSILVESREGEGSCFTVRLPLLPKGPC